jgi:hypothetical protein
LLDNHKNIDEIHINFKIFRIGSLATFGAAGGLTVCYLTDWKAVLQYMPYYGGKFETEEKK